MKLSKQSNNAPTAAPLQSLAQGSMFWRPEHIEQSAWLDHLPWIFWLMEAVHPQRCVTLGARRGSPHLALCQGVSRLGLDSECLLVAEDNDTAAEIHALADRRYGPLAGRLNVSPRRSVKKLDVGGIDILALDLAPDDEDMEDVLERWLSQMSDRGVVLIPGINRREPGCVTHEHFAALQVIYRSITFHQGDGLGVVMVGERPPELLETLISRWNAPTAARTVREVFARLGRACVDQALADAQTARLHSVKERLETVEQERAERIASLEQLQNQLKERDKDLAGLEADKLHLAEENADAQRLVQSLQTELAQVRAQLTDTEASLREAEQRSQSLEAVVAEKEANIQTRFRELATMTNIAEEADQQKDYFKQRAETYNQRNEEKKAELKQFRKAFGVVQQQLNARSEEVTTLKAGMEKLERELEKRDRSLADRFDELGSLTAALEEKERELVNLRGDGASHSLTKGAGLLSAKSHGLGIKSSNRKDQERKRRKQQEALAELEASEWFDSQWYLKQYPDIASDSRYSATPALHYLKFGGFEGRDPSPHFDSAGYLEAYPDVAFTEINPLLHFIRDGIGEGRSPRP
ncbi:hypothetical protein [Salinicola sp. MH3R3-1]|uniref:hypothetical protein n=1 Tax=Salinicola sp. MH3R3-1 TaxID=1928762 RepID=UPI000AEFEEFD|nr:hypothetical protein [Salinicola sp. MH3R3-1]